MKRIFLTHFSVVSVLLLAACDKKTDAQVPVRVAVIGGMTSTGLWDMVAAGFTSRTGIPVELVGTGPKEVLDKLFRAGGIDLVTMHSSDTATNLVADGLAANLHPWACNELVIVGPVDDPAGIRGMTDGAMALKIIAERRLPFVEARNTGSQTVSNTLWRKLGVNPAGDWVIKDEGQSRWDVVAFARSRGAHVIVGRIPVLTGRLPSPGMEVLVQGDPAMRRPFVTAEAVPSKTHSRNPSGARKLADFLTSSECQRLIAAHAEQHANAGPLFFPIERN